MAADVRRCGGVLPAHLLQCGTHSGGVGGHTVPIGLLATGHHGHPQAGGHCRYLTGASHGLGMPGVCAGQSVPDTGGTTPPALSSGGAEGVGDSSYPLTSMNAATPIFRCLPTWTRMASHATSTPFGLRLSHPVTTFSSKTPAVVTVPSSPIDATPFCTSQCPRTSLYANGPMNSCPSGRLDPPMTTMGQGKEMRRVRCTPRDTKTVSHTAERCRCRPSRPGGTFGVQAGSGCLGLA